MLKIKPPTHKIDGGGIVISSLDCWDWARVELECKALEEVALGELRDKAAETFLQGNQKASDAEVDAVRLSCILSDEERTAAHMRHPVQRYLAGQTRYQPDAPDWDHEGKPITARAYLTGLPTEFYIRRLSFSDYHRAVEITSTIGRLTAFVRRGLRAIRSPGDGLQWELKREDEVPDDILQALHEANPLLIRELGGACIIYNRPLDDIEGKR